MADGTIAHRKQESTIMLPCPNCAPPFCPPQYLPPVSLVLPLSDATLVPYSSKLGYTFARRSLSYHGLDEGNFDVVVLPVLEVPKGKVVRLQTGGKKGGKGNKRKRKEEMVESGATAAAAAAAGDDPTVVLKTCKFGNQSLPLSLYSDLASNLSAGEGGGWTMPFVWHDNTRRRVGEILKLHVRGKQDGGEVAGQRPNLIPVWDELEDAGNSKRWLIDYLRDNADLSSVTGFIVVSTTPVSPSFVSVLRSLKAGVNVYCPYLETPEDLIGMAGMGVGLGAGCAVASAEAGLAINIDKNPSTGEWEVSRVDLKDQDKRQDMDTLSPLCGCLACREPRRHSKGYLHHLWKTGEITGKVLNTSHNLWQLAKLSGASASEESH